MVTMTGSEKQVTWANDIRNKAIANIEALNDEQFAEELKALRARFDTETEARWWIDRRDAFGWLAPRSWNAMPIAQCERLLRQLSK